MTILQMIKLAVYSGLFALGMLLGSKGALAAFGL